MGNSKKLLNWKVTSQKEGKWGVFYGRSPQKTPHFPLLIVILLMVLSGLWIAIAVVRFRYLQLDFDEAIHAGRGLDFASAALRGNLPEIWQNFIKPEWYPPVHGMLLGSWFLLVGASVETARLFSAIFYVLFGLLLWISIREIQPHAHRLACLLAPLFLVADRLHATYAALSMLELPAITLSFTAIFFFNRAWRTKRLSCHLLAFLFLWLSLLTKYNYGLVVLATFVIGYALLLWPQLKNRKVTHATGSVVVLWIFFLLLVGLWFFSLGHWRWLFSYASAQPERYTLWSAANLLYYPRLLMENNTGWIVIVLSVVGGLLLIRRRSFPSGLVPYVAFFTISLVMLTLELQKIPRFGMLLFPPLWIIAAIGLGAIIPASYPRRLRTAGYLVLIMLMLIAAFANMASYRSWLFETYENGNSGVDDAYRFIAETLDVSQEDELDLVMFGRTDLWNGPALRFHLETQCLFSETGCKITVLDTRELRRGWPEQDLSEEEQNRRKSHALAAADYLVLFANKPEQLDGWDLIAEDDYTFERQFQKPAHMWVSIFKPQPPE